jgi:hypothetical protein
MDEIQLLSIIYKNIVYKIQIIQWDIPDFEYHSFSLSYRSMVNLYKHNS